MNLNPQRSELGPNKHLSNAEFIYADQSRRLPVTHASAARREQLQSQETGQQKTTTEEYVIKFSLPLSEFFMDTGG